MGDDLSLKFGIEGADAKKAVDEVTTSLEGAAVAADKATAAAKGTGPAIEEGAAKAAPALTALEQAAKNLQDALDKLSTATGPRALMKDSAAAQIALHSYEEEAKAAGVSTDFIGKKAEAAGAQILAASTKAAIFNKSIGEMRAAGQSAANQLDALRGSAGSLEGMLSKMEKTGTDGQRSIASLGLGIAVGKIAFDGAVAAAKALNDTINTMIEKNEKLTVTSYATRAASELHAAAMRALNAGLIQNSDTTAGLIANYQNLILSHGRGSQAARDHADALLGLTGAMIKQGDIESKGNEVAAALAGRREEAVAATHRLYEAEQALNQVRDTEPNDINKVKDAEIAVGLARDQSNVKNGEYVLALQKSEAVLRQQEAAYRALGRVIPEETRDALNALDELKKKNLDLAESWKRLDEIAKNVPAAMQKQIDIEAKLAAATKFVADSNDKLYPTVQKILETYRQEAEAARLSTDSANLTALANAKAAAALAALAKEHQLTVEQVMKLVEAQGALAGSTNATDENIAKQIAQLTSYSGALDAAAVKTETLTDRTARLNAELKAMNEEADRQTTAIKERNQSIDAAQKATDDFAAAQREGIAFEGQATIIKIDAIKATKEQTASLIELLKAQNSYSASVENSLSAVDQWNNYLAILSDSYKNGTTDLLAYKEALQMFMTQLQQNFGSATGKAKEGLESVIAAVRRLIDTAGAGGGPSTDQTMSGALNRALNTAP